MPQPVYATAAELADYLGRGQPPDDAERSLTQASRVVDGVLIGAVYDTDDQGFPTDQDVRDVLRTATLLQAAYWFHTGNPAEGAATYGNVSIGSVSLSNGQSPPTISLDGQTLAPGLVNTLRVAGLLPVTPFVFG